ncbi:ABC transporter permease [Alkaliphilus peptidifermentans]|uniref:Peptide/nickel transport system permease protein n=1 Tax=Alkaliphilus peptidifermentans DSM 18978 TaxID=1120976 RepID=A0A1G5JKY3_9FIRM|nr:ABC transporter permease [Alkaliphilus peptidifermentans]SCY88986.1 peptide/nickel transport system permease protein [Alkaliphilus peptidifermentans DSM 18978]
MKKRRISTKDLGIYLVGLMIVIGILAPYIIPYDPGDFSYEPLQPPNRMHLLGTNYMGQDIFSSLIMGFRVSIFIALSSAFISTLIGSLMAVMCAYYKGPVEAIIIKATELFLILPEIIMIMVFSVFAGPGISNIILVISFFSWSRVTRIIYWKAKVAMTYNTIQYSLLLKGGLFHTFKKLWKHIYAGVVTMFILQCSRAIMYEANLSFLGIGDPTIKSWGRLIRQAIDYDGIFIGNRYIWWLFPPIICIIVLICALSLLSFDMERDENELKEITVYEGIGGK